MANYDAHDPRQNEALGLGAAEPIEPVEGAEIVPGAASAVERLNDPAVATQRALKSGPDVARQFLLATGRPVHHLIAFPSLGGPPSGGWAVDVTDDAAWAAAVSEMAARNRAKNGIYWHVNPVRAEAGSKWKYGKADIEQVDWLHLDLDPDLPKGSTADEYLDTTARLLASTTAFVKRGHMPTLAVMSGNGIQLLYRLAEPLTVDEGEAAVAKLQTVVNAMDGISCSGTQNADRVLRVPGFINWANAKKMKQGYPKQIMSKRLNDDPSRRTTLEALLDGEAVSEGPRAHAAPAAARSAPVPAPAPPVGPSGPELVVPAQLAGWMALMAQPDEAGNFLIDAATDADKAKRRRRAAVQSGDNDSAKLDAAMTWHDEQVSICGRYFEAFDGEAFDGDRSKCLMAQAKACAESGQTYLGFVHIIVAGGGAGLEHAADQGRDGDMKPKARAVRRAWEATEGEDWGICDVSTAAVRWATVGEVVPAGGAGDEVLDDGDEDEVVTDAEMEALPTMLRPFLLGVDVLHPPGAMGELVEWALAISVTQSREAALAGAIHTVSGLAGNTYFVDNPDHPTSLSSHVVLLAATGGGKEGALKPSDFMFKALGHGWKRFVPASAPACRNEFARLGGAGILRYDEAGAMLVTSKLNAGSVAMEVMEVAKEIVAKNGGDLDARAYARARDATKAVNNPALAMFMASTKEKMIEALGSGDTSDGFMNRMTLMESHGLAPKNASPMKPEERAVSLLRMAQRLSHLVCAPPNPESPPIEGLEASPVSADLFREVELPGGAKVRLIPMDEGAVAVYRALDAAVWKYRGRVVLTDKMRNDLAARTVEFASRWAGMLALADAQPCITEADMRWGVALSLRSMARIVALADDHIADNAEQAAEKGILRYLKGKHPKMRGRRGDHWTAASVAAKGAKSSAVEHPLAIRVIQQMVSTGDLVKRSDGTRGFFVCLLDARYLPKPEK